MKLFCDANPKDTINFTQEPYGVHIGITSEEGFSEVLLSHNDAKTLFEFLSKTYTATTTGE